MYSVTIESVMNEFHLRLLTEGVNLDGKVLMHMDVNRPALQLAGFYDYFDNTRLQIIGMVEYSYLKNLKEDDRIATFRRLFSRQVPALVICRDLRPFPEMLDFGREYNVPVFQTSGSTSDFMGEVIRWLKVKLASRITIHGVLVDVFGEGIMIMGESGIGKSECALELIKRGHRLVADDAVEVKRVSSETLIGSCPELIRYFIELRGIGIIDVKQMFGVESIKATQSIDLIIKLEAWEKDKVYDRLGLNEEFMEILGNKIICHSIPIRPGRNLAVICEAAAINHRQKKMGYNAAQVLHDRVESNLF